MANGSYRAEHARHARLWRFWHWAAGIFARARFNFRGEEIVGVQEPYLLLANHNMDCDPIVLGSVNRPQIYFVASEHLSELGLLSTLLNYNIGMIYLLKGKTAASSAMDIMRHMKAGYNVAMFPEGNRSFDGVTGPIPAATGKLARRCGGSLVTYRIQGGYLSNPRWGKGVRKGRVNGTLVHVYSPEELAAMSDAQVQACIERDLFEDAYARQEQEEQRFKSPNGALWMESTLFACPVCGRFGTLHSDVEGIGCDCGFKGTYVDTGYLNCNDGVRRSLKDCCATQLELLAAALEDGGEDPLFSDRVKLRLVGAGKGAVTYEGVLELYREHARFLGDEGLIREIAFDDLNSVAIIQRNHTLVHPKAGVLGEGVRIEIDGDVRFNSYKYRCLMELVKGR